MTVFGTLGVTKSAMGRKRKVDPMLLGVAERLKLRGFDTLGRITDLLEFQMDLTAEESSHPFIVNLAQGDFALTPTSNPEKPWRLALRPKILIENLLRVLQFQSPILRSASVTSEHSESWRIEVVQFGPGLAPENILPPHRRNRTLPMRSLDVPADVTADPRDYHGPRQSKELDSALISDGDMNPAALQPPDPVASVPWPEL